MNDRLEHKILVVGESWGKDEAEAQQAFVGYTGRILKQLLRQVGLDPHHMTFTNVFNFQPTPTNDVKNLCGAKPDGIKWMPFLQRGKYVAAGYAQSLLDLKALVEKQKPNLIIACGATAAWALCKTNGIKNIRGAPLSTWYDGIEYKVMPMYHPSAVARDWKLRPILLADLHKAKVEAAYPDIRRPNRTIWIEPTLKDIERFYYAYIVPSPDLSIDIETHGEQITCIGFAPTKDIALVIPFYDPRQLDSNYWRYAEEEVSAYEWMKFLCGLDKRIVGQNFMYDLNFLFTKYGISVPHMTDDTMLLHHAMQPEMEKGLGFLASIYTDEVAWKFMRTKHTKKRED